MSSQVILSFAVSSPSFIPIRFKSSYTSCRHRFLDLPVLFLPLTPAVTILLHFFGWSIVIPYPALLDVEHLNIFTIFFVLKASACSLILLQAPSSIFIPPSILLKIFLSQINSIISIFLFRIQVSPSKVTVDLMTVR